MKHFLLVPLLIFSSNTFSQPARDSFITAKYGIDTIDAIRIYNGLLEIDVSKYYIPATFSKYHCDLIIEEYYEGKLIKKQSFLDSIPDFARFTLSIESNLQQGGFELALYSQKKDTTLKIYGILGGAGLKKDLRLKPKLAYSWKEIYDLQLKKHALQPGTPFPVLVYTSAIDPKHSKFGEDAVEFCRISGELISYNDWYKELGIKHFFLFSVRLAEK